MKKAEFTSGQIVSLVLVLVVIGLAIGLIMNFSKILEYVNLIPSYNLPEEERILNPSKVEDVTGIGKCEVIGKVLVNDDDFIYLNRWGKTDFKLTSTSVKLNVDWWRDKPMGTVKLEVDKPDKIKIDEAHFNLNSYFSQVFRIKFLLEKTDNYFDIFLKLDDSYMINVDKMLCKTLDDIKKEESRDLGAKWPENVGVSLVWFNKMKFEEVKTRDFLFLKGIIKSFKIDLSEVFNKPSEVNTETLIVRRENFLLIKRKGVNSKTSTYIGFILPDGSVWLRGKSLYLFKDNQDIKIDESKGADLNLDNVEIIENPGTPSSSDYYFESNWKMNKDIVVDMINKIKKHTE